LQAVEFAAAGGKKVWAGLSALSMEAHRAGIHTKNAQCGKLALQNCNNEIRLLFMLLGKHLANQPTNVCCLLQSLSWSRLKLD
jgi:hypothetical protein